MKKWLLLACLAATLPVLPVRAQNTGKLTGRVTDAQTGDPLPGTNVLLIGTGRGAAAGVDGRFDVLGVPVGVHHVRVSFVGYQTVTIEGIEINAGYTRDLGDVSLRPGVEVEAIVVEYERPLIQKDAVGVPRIVSSEEIVNLPVRGAANVAAIQAGVVSQEGSSTLNIRGGRGSEVTYFIDGVKVIGGTGLPQSAIQEQEMLIGNINARYGDVMSGVISITTKSGAPTFFGSLEGITSQGLDPWGYNLASATLGGPIVRNRLSFFLAGEFTDQRDSNPRAFGELRVSDALLEDLRAAPIAFPAWTADSQRVFLPIPAGLANGATLLVDDDGRPVVHDGRLLFDDGTTVAVPGGVDVAAIDLRPILRAEQVRPDQFEVRKDKRSQTRRDASWAGNLTWNVIQSGRLRLGGRYARNRWDNTNSREVVFAPEMRDVTEDRSYQVYGTWTQYLSNATFYQVQADFSDVAGENYDPRFGRGFDDLLDYGNLDEHPAFATVRGYKDMALVDETRVDADGRDITVAVPTYTNTYSDGAGPAANSEVVSTLVQVPGGRFNSYGRWHDTQFRLSASATTQLGINQLAFGAEYEQRTQRAWTLNAEVLARFVNDASGPEQIARDDPDLDPDGYSRYDEIPTFVLDDFVRYYGYNVRGTGEVNDEDLEAFISQDITKPDRAYNIAPYEPVYYGAYLQDKIEFRDIVLNLGLRVDVFDNNTRVLENVYARRPVCSAGELLAGGPCAGDRSGTLPEGIGPGFTVYYNGDAIVGYRNYEGIIYDANGQLTDPVAVLLEGKPRQTRNQITEAMFEDYEPAVTWMPRIGVSFPVTDRALFFASYGIVSQRPPEGTYASLHDLRGTDSIPNNDLRPQTTTKYELGFRQRVGTRTALTLSGYFHQVKNLIERGWIDGASPGDYVTWTNLDFATAKGVEFGFDLRRTRGVAVHANYTLATVSRSYIRSTDVLFEENYAFAPAAWDQRHRMNLSLDYRLGAGQGPMLFGAKVLEHAGINVLVTAGSGFPYTRTRETLSLAGGAASRETGGINDARMPAQQRVDVRLDRRFPLGDGSSVTAFLWVQNVFDAVNVNNVWPFTGMPDNDGFLATPQGERFLADKPISAEPLYRHRNRMLSWVGLPRLTRLGVRVDF